ncbi:MAG: NAD-dependent epimerase/dehydratase family protein, partial [Verrucomicrobia bacterium]|nr:NAD-dependent epimerase/dehydratase family protein [Verrucomicrobiota bacterium]
MNATTPFRIGLIGAGYVCQYHLLALRRLAGVHITGVCDLDLARAQATGCPAFATTQELYAAGVDVVHVLTPPASHAALTIEALEHGCHVLVEKPLATSAEDCDRIAAAAAKTGKLVCVNHSLLRDPFITRALAMVRAGAVGDILTVDYFRSSDYAPWPGGALPPQYRDGGYPFRDLGVHALYLLQEFLGDIHNVEAEFHSAERLSRDPNILYDEWRALVRCAKGTGQIQLSWNVRPLQHVLQVQGTRGVLRADLFGLNVTLKRNTPLPKAIERLTNALGESRQIGQQVLANAWRFARKRLLPYHGLQMLIADFYTALGSGLPVPVPVERARAVVDWTERVARPADDAKQQFLRRSPAALEAPVLITGATGFIGRALLRRLLAENQRVRILVRREPLA